jgi:hypothetical protein
MDKNNTIFSDGSCFLFFYGLFFETEDGGISFCERPVNVYLAAHGHTAEGNTIPTLIMFGERYKR